MNTHAITTINTNQTIELGRLIGSKLRGGDVIVMSSDVGGGKTTLTKGIAKGMGVDEPVQSPTFTISAQYRANSGQELHHYDFYRLDNPGIMTMQLAESLQQDNAVIVIEWPGIIEKVLEGVTYMTISISAGKEPNERSFVCRMNADIEASIKEARDVFGA